MNKLNYEILSAIDNIETTVIESEMNVMSSIIDTYNKAVIVLENCNDDTNIDSFSIFQESKQEKEFAGISVAKKNPKQIIIDILLFIPRMIKKCFNKTNGKNQNKNKSINEKIVFEVNEDEKTTYVECLTFLMLLNIIKVYQ